MKKVFLISLFFMLMVSISIFSAPKTLKGGNSRYWNNNGSWSPSGVPTASDDVIIARNSTNLVVDANAVCASFTIETVYSRTISFSGTHTLTVSGDWTNNGAPVLGSGSVLIGGNFTNNYSSLDVTTTDFTFNGTSDQTISSASNPANTLSTFGSLTIDNPGNVTLLTDVGVETSFTITQGTADLNGNELYLSGEPYTGPLPVELSSFSAVILESGIKLKWRTETEVNNYGFEILRQAQDDKWDVLGFVEGHGNSNSPKEYNFTDNEVNAAGIYSYRLKQIDNDGSYEFSKTIKVNIGSPISFELNQNYPNPFNPSTTIRFSVSESSFINLLIFNSLGEKIEERVNEVKDPGVHTIEFNAQDLPSGTYFYRIQINDFTQTKKMILIK
jgi:hypothetical protein